MTSNKKKPQVDLSQADEARVQQVIDARARLAEALHECTSRAQAEQLFQDIFTADEVTQLSLIRRLTRQREIDAADLLLALHELAPGQAVRKDAKRGLIYLTSAK